MTTHVWISSEIKSQPSEANKDTTRLTAGNFSMFWEFLKEYSIRQSDAAQWRAKAVAREGREGKTWRTMRTSNSRTDEYEVHDRY